MRMVDWVSGDGGSPTKIRPIKIKNLLKNIRKYKKVVINYSNNSKGFSLDIKKSIKYKLPIPSTKKMFLTFLDENIKNLKIK